MIKEKYNVSNKEITLYMADATGSPLVVLNVYEGDGSDVVEALAESKATDCSLLCIGGLDWNHDMSPWQSAPIFKGDTPCTGGADEYLSLLTGNILPKAYDIMGGRPDSISIAGYSLAGLFALYSVYRCGEFNSVASISGSLWFPDFVEYACSHGFAGGTPRIYLSLGDKEAVTGNKVLKTVQARTEQLASYYRSLGLTISYELNPGNHFTDETGRTAKGIRWILTDTI